MPPSPPLGISAAAVSAVSLVLLATTDDDDLVTDVVVVGVTKAELADRETKSKKKLRIFMVDKFAVSKTKWEAEISIGNSR